MSHLYKQKEIFWLAFYRHGKLYRESLKTKDRATAKYQQAKKDQELIDTKYLTLNAMAMAVFEEYKASYAHTNAKATQYRDEARIRGFLGCSHVQKIHEITDKVLQDYFNAKISAGMASITVNRIIATLKAFLNFAVRRKYIQENPAKGIKKYRLPENPPPFLTKDQISKVLKEAKKEDLYPAVAAGIYTGMRQAEIFNLEWTDVDFDRNVITVCNKPGFTTKSKRFRVIPLHPALKPILTRIKRREGLCFDTINNRRVLNRILRNAKVKYEGKTWHLLRHSFASNLVMSGVDLVTISKLLGHASITTTMIYSHLAADHIKGAVEKLKF